MVRAIEMAYSDKFSHERPDGNMCYYIMRDFGQDIYGVGENIASRQHSWKTCITMLRFTAKLTMQK